MTKRYKKTQRSRAGHANYVIVAFVNNVEQAREYEALLRAEGIAVFVRKQCDKLAAGEGPEGFAVMVPEEMLDEAIVVIESQEAYDDFYDFSMDDEAETDEEDYGGADVFEHEDDV